MLRANAVITVENLPHPSNSHWPADAQKVLELKRTAHQNGIEIWWRASLHNMDHYSVYCQFLHGSALYQQANLDIAKDKWSCAFERRTM